MSEDPIHRANRWHSFYHEDGGLKEFLDVRCDAYLAKAGNLLPSQTAELNALGIARKVVEEMRQEMIAIFTAGKIEAAAQDHAHKIAKLSEARRRFL